MKNLLTAALAFQAALQEASKAQPGSSYSELDDLTGSMHPDTINAVCDGVNEMVEALKADSPALASIAPRVNPGDDGDHFNEDFSGGTR
jgi:hypothetical protein